MRNRKVIALIVCFAVCASNIAVGVSNLTPNKGTVTKSGGLSVIVGTAEEINLTRNILSKTADGYMLNGNVVITDTKDAAYAELQVLNRTDGDDIVLDGNGCTVTTSVPLFKTIANCTVKNLTVNADIAATDDDVAVHSLYHGVGAIAGIAYGTVYFEDVTVNGYLTYAGASYKTLNAGGFVGILNNVNSNSYKTAEITFTDCENNVGIILDPKGATDTSQSFNTAGGFIGCGNFSVSANFNNTVNNGNIYATSSAVHCYVGGFVGYLYNTYGYFTNAANYGTVEGKTTGKYAYVGGFIGLSNDSGFTDCINYGNVKSDAGTSRARASGFVTDTQTERTFLRCINTGNINATGATGHPVSGIVGYCSKSPQTLQDCLNVGTVSGNTGLQSGIDAYSGSKIQSFYSNVYTIAVENDACSARNKFNGGGNNHLYLIKSPDASYIENAKNKKINNAAALIAVILATADYADAHDNDTDGKTLNSLEGFTVTAIGKSAFTASINKAFYDDVVAIAGNVEFGGIITVEEYISEIGVFTHEKFDEYLANSSLEVASLYLTAEFDDGREAKVLTADELAGNNYEINVTLNGATPEYTYAARTFIKIGTNAYIYSK